ncbi:MAG: sigma-70 family RNA polymerase sigma factor [Cyanobacteria bacterium P01_F01_bin.150]
MIDYDQHLQQLALHAQQHPAHSAQQRLALTKLIHALKQSGKITRPMAGAFPGLYDAIYDEALQRLFVHICSRIDSYDPQKGKVLQWVNFLLSRRFFIEASRDVLPTLPKGINPKEVTRLSLDELDRHHPSDLNPCLIPSAGEELRHYIEEDPAQLLCSVHIENHPTVTFQWLAIKRLNGFSWKELSAELDIRIPTLSSFYQRTLKRFSSIFKDYLS